MEFNIVFGSRKTSRDGAFQKYSDKSVITIEAEKEAGKSRRMLFNKTAMEVLGLTEGEQQKLLFGFVEQDEVGNRRLLIAEVTDNENMKDEVTYSTSKNKIAFDGSKEKGKGISSKVLMNEINEFLEVDEKIQHEYTLVVFSPEGMPETGLNLFELVKLSTDISPNANDDMINEEEGAPFDEDLSEENVVMEEEVKPIQYPEGTRIDTTEDEF